MSREERRGYVPRGCETRPGVVRKPVPKFEPPLVLCRNCGTRMTPQDAAGHLARCRVPG